jgi:hypothetical protein
MKGGDTEYKLTSIKNKLTTIQPNSSYYIQGKKKKYKFSRPKKGRSSK